MAPSTVTVFNYRNCWVRAINILSTFLKCRKAIKSVLKNVEMFIVIYLAPLPPTLKRILWVFKKMLIIIYINGPSHALKMDILG
jgi:transposase